MKRFVISKYSHPVVLSSLAASLLMGAVSAPAWAASTDVAANNLQSTLTTSGQAQSAPEWCIPQVQDALENLQHLLAPFNVSLEGTEISECDANIPGTPVGTSGTTSIPVDVQRSPSSPSVGAPDTASTPASAQNSSTPENTQDSGTPAGAQSPGIRENAQNSSNTQSPGTSEGTQNPSNALGGQNTPGGE